MIITRLNASFQRLQTLLATIQDLHQLSDLPTAADQRP
jgi:hypothetical protein